MYIEKFLPSINFSRNNNAVVMSIIIALVSAFLIVQGLINLIPFLFLIPLLLFFPEKALIGGMFILVSTSAWLNYRLFGGRFENVVTIPLLIIFTLIFVWFIVLTQFRIRIVKSPIVTAMLIFIGTNLLSTIFNYPGFYTRHLLLGNVIHFLNFSLSLIVASITAASFENSRRITILFLVGIMIGSVGAGISQFSTFLHSSRILWKTNPIYTESLEKSGLGIFGAIIVFMALAIIFETKNYQLKLYAAIQSILGVFINIFAWQRTHFIGLVSGIAIILFARGKKLVFFLVITMILVVNTFPLITETIYNVFTFQRKSFTTRVELWKESFDVWKKNPIVGVGPSQYRQGISWAHPHNQYLATLAETGILGFSSFMVLFVILFYESWRTYQEAKNFLLRLCALGLLGILTGQAVGGLGSLTLLPNYGRMQFAVLSWSSYIWVLIGLMVGLKAKFLFRETQNS